MTHGQPVVALLLVSLVATSGLRCAADPTDPATGPAPPVRPKSTAALPAALRVSYLRARQNEAGTDPAFQAQRVAPTTFVTDNPVHDVQASLDVQGLHLRRTRRADLPAVSLTLQHYGCAAAPRLAAPTPPRLGLGPNRVEYPRDGLREWYVNGPLGLEHGFTVEQDPGCEDGGRLAFALLLSGELLTALSGQGAATHLELRDPSSPNDPPVLLYSDLLALDADGRELPSRMLLVGRTVRLEVDAAGARYPVTVDPMWTQQASLVASDGAAGDSFGTSVAIDGDTAVIGAASKSVGPNLEQGQAYVFVRSGTSWSQQAILVDDKTGTPSDQFGNAVAISGDTIIVGAFHKNVGGNSQQGQAYVFIRSGTSWSLQAILADIATGTAFDSFGGSISVSGDNVLIGAAGKKIDMNNNQGQAYVFVRSGTVWSPQTILVDRTSGEDNDQFGCSVALSGETAVIGTYGKSVGSHLEQGLAYVFVRVGAFWSQQAILVDSATGKAGDLFGTSVALSGETAVVSAYYKTVGFNPAQGQVYVFVRSGTFWSQQAVLRDTRTGAPADVFGWSVALHGDTIAVGAALKRVGANASQGQGYVFVRSGTTWTQQSVLVDLAAGKKGDFFGFAVAVSEDTAVIGAFDKQVGVNLNQGQAYVFASTAHPNGTPCLMGSQCASTFCVDGLCCNGACGGGVDADCQSCLGAQTGGSDGVCGVVTQAVNYPCRAAIGVCDQAELCDGLSASCPPDALYQPADHHLCRAATSCSRGEYCDGSTVHCPPSLCLPPWL